MTITRMHTDIIQGPAVCPICDGIFNGVAVTIDAEPAVYCSHTCAGIELELRDTHTAINEDTWNPLYSCYGVPV